MKNVSYLAVPFAFGNLGSIDKAISKLLACSSKILLEGGMAVNPLFTVDKIFTEKEFYAQAKCLIDASDRLIVLGDWGYSKVTIEELGYAYYIKREVIFLND